MDAAFLVDFKRRTEERWANARLELWIYGFQIQPGTRWLPGLSDSQIDEYQAVLGVTFPHDFREFLRHFNGTDRENLNIYGNSGEPHRTRPGAYSYPRDLAAVRALMSEWEADWPEIVESCELDPAARCVPIYLHRGVLCGPDLGRSTVMSIMGTDAIVYAPDLRSYLEKEFLREVSGLGS